MEVKVYDDPGMIRVVQAAIDENPYRRELEVLLDKVKDYDHFYWGGIVRNGVLKYMHGIDIASNDIDLILEASTKDHGSLKTVDFEKLLQGFQGIIMNRYGLPKWKPKQGVEFDISAFSECNKARVYGSTDLDITAIVEGCDLTTSAIAFDPREKKIYSYRAIESYATRTIDINFPEGSEPCALLPRLLLHSKKLGFGIGEESRRYISNFYDNGIELKGDILDKMTYWGTQREFFKVISILKEISGTTPARRFKTSYF